MKWESDREKIERAIVEGAVAKQNNILKFLRGAEALKWEFPADLLADEVSQKPPIAFGLPKIGK